MGRMVCPSQKHRTVTSRPVMHSSISTRAPDAPKRPSSIMARTASRASSSVCATTTPLPSARPSALTTMGACWPSR